MPRLVFLAVSISLILGAFINFRRAAKSPQHVWGNVLVLVVFACAVALFFALN